jgi:hypothetical protein
VRHLQGFQIDHHRYNKLMVLKRSLENRPYEKNKIELIKAAYDGPMGDNDKNLSSLFCSELVAEAYQCLGLLSAEPPSNEYTPKDFAEEANLELLGGASLGKEIPLLSGTG